VGSMTVDNAFLSYNLEILSMDVVDIMYLRVDGGQVLCRGMF